MRPSNALDAFKKSDRRNAGIIVTLVGFHLAALAALLNFHWWDIAVAGALYWVAMSWGIGMCYHRLLTHRGFKTSKAFEYFLAVCGTLALEGGPISWVATHRVHHQFADKEGDPHTPNDGRWWSHAGWVMTGNANHCDTQLMKRFCPDLASDRFYLLLNTYHWAPTVILGLVLLAFGGWSMVLWGLGVRVVLGWHGTWFVNSATHMWGSRRFPTHDDSRNSFWVALLTFGEGWHNNHHAHPVSARHGLAWYELDLTWVQIRCFEILGLIRDPYVPHWRCS